MLSLLSGVCFSSTPLFRQALRRLYSVNNATKRWRRRKHARLGGSSHGWQPLRTILLIKACDPWLAETATAAKAASCFFVPFACSQRLRVVLDAPFS